MTTKKRVRIPFLVVYVCLALSPVAAVLVPHGKLERALRLVGNYWFGVIFYVFLFVGVADIIRLIVKAVNRKHPKHMLHTDRFRMIAGGIVALCVLATTIYGVINAQTLHTTEYDITVDKPCAAGDLKVVLVADTHLGYNIGVPMMRKMVAAINEQKPDIVCFAGDFFNNEYEALDDPETLLELFRSIDSKYGTYACWGNHDIEEKTLAGFTFDNNVKHIKLTDTRMRQFVLDSGITLLEDESKVIDGAFTVVGRRDEERPGNESQSRLSPEELLADVDLSMPVIVIDHEPRDLQQLADAGADMDLCGHTHDGQIFPGNLIIKLAWENACGYLKKGDMHNIVTSGVGLYGPNMRTGTIAEIAAIRVHFAG